MLEEAAKQGFYDFQLTHPVELTTADFIGSQAMLYYVEPEFARRFYHLSFHDSVEFEIMRRFPALADRHVQIGTDYYIERVTCSGLTQLEPTCFVVAETEA